MASFYFFLIAGLALLVLELVTTTFYFLVIGLASIIASITALILHDWAIPSISAAILSIIGCFLIFRSKCKNNKGGMIVDHIGQTAEIVEINANNIRVLYSGSHWDAKANTKTHLKVGDKVRITKFSNYELEVEKENLK